VTWRVGRVVVRLDAASESRPGIDTAARLAASWRVPLRGVFVEDEELLALAALPFAVQITLAAGRGALRRAEIEGHLRAFAERARREVAAAAERHGVEWSFAVVRGSFAEDEDDFIVAGGAARPLGGQAGLPPRWQPAAHPLLLARREWAAGGSVTIMLRRRGPPAARLLAIAAEIARLGGGMLTVLGAADAAGPESDDFAAWVAAQLEGRPLILRTELVDMDPAALRQRFAAIDCRLLVLEASAPEEELRGLVERVACDVLLLR
jgi:hypothetical protein